MSQESVYISSPTSGAKAPAKETRVAPPSKNVQLQGSVFITGTGTVTPAPQAATGSARPCPPKMEGSVFMGGPPCPSPQPAPASALKSTTAKASKSVVGTKSIGSKSASSPSSVSFKSVPSSSPASGGAPGSGSIIKAPEALGTKSASGKTPVPAGASKSLTGVKSISGKSAAVGKASELQIKDVGIAAPKSTVGKAAASKSALGKAPASGSIIKAPEGASKSLVGAKSVSNTSTVGLKSVASQSQGGKAASGSALGKISAKSVLGAVDPSVVAKIEEGYATLQNAADCKSLLKKHMTKDVMEKLKTQRTSFGSTLYDVIQSGVKNLDSGVGVYAPDAEAYRTFIDLFDPILAEYHGFKPSDKQPPVDLGENKISEFTDLDPEQKFIVSTRIRCGRSIRGYPFNPCLTEDNYKEMEQKMVALFSGLQDPELQGVYYPLTGMTKEVQNELIKDHFLFKEGDRFLREANACRFWPSGRGIFLNKSKTFLVWVNEEDHLRIISMQPGGNVGQVLDRLIRGLKLIEAQMPFSRDERYGWLTFCPTNLGTTIRASVHVKIPKVSKKPEFKKICDEMKLQIRGIHGEHSETEGGVYDISNRVRLGFSEYAVIKQMYDGVKKLLELERAA